MVEKYRSEDWLGHVVHLEHGLKRLESWYINICEDGCKGCSLKFCNKSLLQFDINKIYCKKPWKSCYKKILFKRKFIQRHRKSYVITRLRVVLNSKIKVKVFWLEKFKKQLLLSAIPVLIHMIPYKKGVLVSHLHKYFQYFFELRNVFHFRTLILNSDIHALANRLNGRFKPRGKLLLKMGAAIAHNQPKTHSWDMDSPLYSGITWRAKTAGWTWWK